MEYVNRLVGIFKQVHRVLKPGGTVFLNIGDSVAKKKYAPLEEGGVCIKRGEQMMIPAIVAMELRRVGYYVKQDIIWAKRNAIPMGGAAPKRFTPSHEYIFMLTKHESDFYFNADAVKEEAVVGAGVQYGPYGGIKRAGGDNASYSGRIAVSSGTRRKRDVWFETTSRCKEAHFAPYPESIVEYCIKAGCPEDGTVLDPFSGTGTTMRVASKLGRKFIGIELYEEYQKMHRVDSN
jgi:site-specific DNA-methyltransferase (adenine-specific)